MNQHQIYIETDNKKLTAERCFFTALLKHWKLDTYFNLLGVGGNTNLSEVKTQLSRTTDAGLGNFIVFDGDCIKNKEGSLAVREELQRELEEYSLTAQIFLLPDNETDGCVETLMKNCVVRKDILDCFECYLGCLQGHGIKLIKNLEKSRIFAYMEAVNPQFSKITVEDFFNPEWWDLDAEVLIPLRTFLENGLKSVTE